MHWLSSFGQFVEVLNLFAINNANNPATPAIRQNQCNREMEIMPSIGFPSTKGDRGTISVHDTVKKNMIEGTDDGSQNCRGPGNLQIDTQRPPI